MYSVMKKKDKAKELIKGNQELFKCPLCNNAVKVNNYSLLCECNHCFDLSKKGYLSLLTTNNKLVYSKELFEARSKICEAGLYDPLINELVNIIENYQEHFKEENKKSINIIDAGCGEGSHIYRLSNKLNLTHRKTYIGIDISKEGINLATNKVNDIIWCVADLARLPFQNNTMDVILNILSPANYTEFHRILKDRGIVVKVVPESEYLIELRDFIYGNNKSYSNDKIISHFTERLEMLESKKITYKFDLNNELLSYLIKMTPLTWGENMDINKLNNINIEDIPNITVDLNVLIGRKKEN